MWRLFFRQGFYINLKELPGPIVEYEDELIESIKNIEHNFNDKYKNLNDKYNYLDDGKATERVVKSVIK